MFVSRGPTWRARALVLAAAASLAIGTVAPVAAESGFKTSTPSMLKAARAGVDIKPLISVGDTLGSYVFEAIPDGIAIDPRGHTTVDVYVNHETSLEPFPPTKVDYVNAELSKLTLKRGAGKVLAASYVIPSNANYQRFCSNFMAGPEQGLDRYLVLTNEEAVQTFNRSGVSYPLTAGGSNPEQAGVVVAYDVDSGAYRSIHRMGRHNHENSVALPGFNQIAILSGDDSFVNNPPNSQLYLYTSPDTDTLWEEGGSLWAFKADQADDDYYDVIAGEVLTGSFIPVPNTTADGDQTALENWSQANGVFDFIRIEDVAYDRTTPNLVYLADSGRGSGAAPNGRIWRMELDPTDPTRVLSLRILLNFDAGGFNNRNVVHQPDNLETTARSLLITEDPSTANKSSATFPDATAARVWRYDLVTGLLEPVLEVDQSLDPAAPRGEWEASGVVDASQYFGPGSFLVDVQAHSLFVGPQTPSPYSPGATQKREGGQLLLVRIDGA
jgi:hypothetical protein